MGDIRMVLRDVAPQPTAPLDVSRIKQLASRRRPRRAALWLASIIGTVGAIVPAHRLLVPAESGRSVATIDSVDEFSEAAEGRPSDSAGSTTQLDSQRVSPASKIRRISPPPDGPAQFGAKGLAPAVSTTTARPPSDFGPAEQCKVDNNGLLPGQMRSCQFTATARGGWRFSDGAGAGTEHNQGVVTVTRSGTTVTYRSIDFQACADDVVQPGDLVRVEFHQSSTDVSLAGYAAAGESWGCWSSGR